MRETIIQEANQKITIQNSQPHTMTLHVEPWGRQYWLEPGDTFELTAEQIEENFHFHIVFEERAITIWAQQSCLDVVVTQDGQPV